MTIVASDYDGINLFQMDTLYAKSFYLFYVIGNVYRFIMF